MVEDGDQEKSSQVLKSGDASSESHVRVFYASASINSQVKTQGNKTGIEQVKETVAGTESTSQAVGDEAHQEESAEREKSGDLNDLCLKQGWVGMLSYKVC